MAPYKKKTVTVKITVDGKQYWIRGDTEKEAREKAVIKKAAILAGERVITGHMSVKDWSEVWLETYKEPKVNSHYYRDITGQVKNKILPSIGDKRVRNIRPADCQQILNDMADDGCSMSYIKSVRDLLAGMFRQAHLNDMIRHNPAEGLELPTGKSKQHRRSLTARERELTLQVAETNRGGLFVLIMLYCGLRPGEVAALRWSDIDMEQRVIHVTRAVKADNTEGEPKTKAGIRDVPIPNPLYSRLQQEQHGPWDRVCTHSKGGRHNRTTIRRLWENFARDLNIAAGCKVGKYGVVEPPFFVQDLTLYCYRHTYCTDLQAAGVPINVARELMGHANISITAEIYTHRNEVSFEDARDKINTFHNPKVAPEVAKIAVPVEK